MRSWLNDYLYKKKPLISVKRTSWLIITAAQVDEVGLWIFIRTICHGKISLCLRKLVKPLVLVVICNFFVLYSKTVRNKLRYNKKSYCFICLTWYKIVCLFQILRKHFQPLLHNHFSWKFLHSYRSRVWTDNRKLN